MAAKSLPSVYCTGAEISQPETFCRVRKKNERFFGKGKIHALRTEFVLFSICVSPQKIIRIFCKFTSFAKFSRCDTISAMAEKSLKKNAVYSFIKAFMNLAFPLISFPYASRILLPPGIGKVNFANSVIEYFTLIAGLGISTYAAREATRVRDNKTLLNKFGREILSIQMVSTLISYVLLFFALIFVPKFSEYRVLIIVCSTKILFFTIGIDWLFNAYEEYRYITVRSVIFQIFSLIFLFLFVKTPDDYVLYAFMGIISSVGSNACNIFYARKFINFFEKTKIETKRHIKPVLIFFGNTCAAKLHTALDSVMIGFMMNDDSVGYYSAASKIKVLVTGVITTVIYTLLPRSSYYIEKNKMDEYREIVKNAANASIFFSIPATFGVILISRQLIMLFSGENFLAAVPAMIAISPVIAVVSFASVLVNVILIPQKKERISFQSQIIGCVLNIILNFVLIPCKGVFGAAIATTAAEVVITIYLFCFSAKTLKGCGIFKNLLQILISCAFMAAVLLQIPKIFRGIASQLFVSIFAGIVVYFALMLIFKNETAFMIFASARKRLTKK
jgi:O-antigen/teichoic acid export membrane protein